MKYGVHLCMFSSLDEVPKKSHSDRVAVGRALAAAGRFSTFEASENQRIAATMTDLGRNGWFVFEPEGYPWTRATVTEEGRKALGLEEDP